jgi:tRNA threonylcarbamoyladenosine biosynthesis protein TsaB
MNILAFDCSTDTVHLAVQAGAARHGEALSGGAATSALLLPRAQAACAALGLRLDQLDAIAFGQGPGAFTGVRAACAAAQGLAYGLGKPVIELPTLEVVARSAQAKLAPNTQTVWVAMDARMGEVYVTRYENNSYKTPKHADLVVISPQKWLVEAAESLQSAQTWVVGNARAAHPGLAALPRWIDALPSADALLDAALERAANRQWVAPAQAAPLYVRNRVALTTREREAGAVL